MTNELIILTDDDFEPEEGQKGWNDPIRNVVGKFREVKLDPTQLEARMSDFVKVVGRIFQQANAEMPPASGLQLEEVELATGLESVYPPARLLDSYG